MPDAVKVVTTIALQGVLEKLAPEFAKKTGFGIDMTFAPPTPVLQLIRDGEPADVVISTPAGIGELVEEGKVAAGSSRLVVKMIMGLAVGKNEPKPDISTPEKFKQALLNARSIIHADPAIGSPSAAHFIKVVEQLGITDQIKPKTAVRAGIVAHAVADGEYAMAVQQLAELMLVDGVDVLGPFPQELQNVIPLAAAVHADSTAAKPAKELIDLLATPRAKSVIEESGLLAAS